MRVLAILFLLSLTACTPFQRKAVGITAGVLIVGAIAAHDADRGKAKPEAHLPAPPCANPEACR